METLDQETFGTTDRVRLVPDYHPDPPDGDCYPPTVFSNLSWLNPQVHDLALNVAEFIELGFDNPEHVVSIVSQIKRDTPGRWIEIATRYFNIFYDTKLFIKQNGPTYALMLSTPHWREVTGVHEDAELDHADCEDGFSYLDGAVYRLVHERLIPACEHGHGDQWVQMDAVSGFYGTVNIAEEADEFFILPDK